MILKPFAKQEDATRQRAAAEATPISIPFKSPTHLELSGGVTDTCYFLQSKATKEIFPWNAVMAEYGNVHFLPLYDMELLNRPEFAGELAVWKAQGVLPGTKKSKVSVAPTMYVEEEATDVVVKPVVPETKTAKTPVKEKAATAPVIAAGFDD